MSEKKQKPGKTPKKPSGKIPSNNLDDLYEDGDIATPKRDFDEEAIKEEQDKRP